MPLPKPITGAIRAKVRSTQLNTLQETHSDCSGAGRPHAFVTLHSAKVKSTDSVEISYRKTLLEI